ncbi:DNA repair protein RecO [Sphingomonas crusticola]|uniref:DNA repair protein RecO n=1 Tax=Sphingomonas crusticola TaxID=1697973 RepID=UPI000E25D117|nr:DNA repair protein RecO [Sphingomonas crusticola]
MHVEAQAIVCAVRAHGEHGAIVRAFTPTDGMLAGYVRGGRSRRLRPILVPGNLVRADFRARTDEQLPALTVELTESRASMLSEALPVAAIEWTTALTATALPEVQPYPRLYAALDGVLAAVVAAPAARAWAAALVRYELLLLSELGFGLDLSACVAGGAREDLAYVSPKSGGAVSRTAGEGYRDRLLPLPPFLTDGGAGDWQDIIDGFRLTGHFLERDLLHGRAAEILAARERLVDRLKRVTG